MSLTVWLPRHMSLSPPFGVEDCLAVLTSPWDMMVAVNPLCGECIWNPASECEEGAGHSLSGHLLSKHEVVTMLVSSEQRGRFYSLLVINVKGREALTGRITKAEPQRLSLVSLAKATVIGLDIPARCLPLAFPSFRDLHQSWSNQICFL